jgi:putative OPT family oligopeptide transporter
MSTPLYPETVMTIAEMAPGEIWTRYVRYIGAGAVATGGLATLIRSIPTMRESFQIGAREMRSRLGEGGTAHGTLRTELDLGLGVVLRVAVAVVAMLAFTPWIFSTLPLAGRIVAAVLVGIFAFFFVTVSSRIVGLVGVTSNPTSGMTIASLLGTSMIFYVAGWTDDVGKVSALLVGCVVAIAASIAGDTSQDLKTGYLLGATPRRQQLGEVVGVLTSAAFVCLTLMLLDGAYGFGTAELPAPQATLMKLVIEGVLDANLPWFFVGVGVVLALCAEIAGLPSLAFAVGIYLPVATMVPVFLGGSLRWWLERRARSEADREARRERGVLLGSGLVGGTGLFSVVLAGAAVWLGRAPEGIGTGWAGPLAPAVGVATILLLVVWFVRGATATGTD